MSTEETLQISTKSSNETEQLGERIGQNLRGGEAIELVSDLGGGKTTFVRGLALGIGSTDKVASPSFTIKREYYAKDLEIHHFDFHRLHSAGEIKHDLEDIANNPKAIVVVEWADIVQDVMPVERLTITIKPKTDSLRLITIKYPERFNYVIKDCI